MAHKVKNTLTIQIKIQEAAQKVTAAKQKKKEKQILWNFR